MLGGTPDARRGAVGSGAGATAISHQQRAGERLPSNRGVSCRAPSPPGPVSFTPELDGGARHTAMGRRPTAVSAGAGPKNDRDRGAALATSPAEARAP